MHKAPYTLHVYPCLVQVQQVYESQSLVAQQGTTHSTFHSSTADLTSTDLGRKQNNLMLNLEKSDMMASLNYETTPNCILYSILRQNKCFLQKNNE